MILVTGYKGFIGSNLLKRLGDQETYLTDNENWYFSGTEILPWDKITKVYHLGAISSTTETNISRIFIRNIQNSINIFSRACQHDIPIVYASSASVYGNSKDYQINPLNYYAMSKATVDYWVQDNIKEFKNIVGLRFFNVYGDGEEHKGSQASPIHQFTKQAKETGVIKVFEGSENYIRDFVWVEDIIDCMLTDMPNGIYDVGTSNPISFQTVAEIIAEKYNATIEIIPFPEHLKEKYQNYTCSRNHFDKQFKTVKDYINVI
jgi:ADP-L-glycero-D-manno-heptose 6-epimerase